MIGHGEKLSRKQELAIAALLSEPTLERAATVAGVSVITLQRWLRLPKYKARYRAACHQIMEYAIFNLQHTTSLAIETLIRNLTCGNPTVEVRAALGVIKQTMKATELLDFESRLSALEEGLSTARWGNGETNPEA